MGNFAEYATKADYISGFDATNENHVSLVDKDEIIYNGHNVIVPAINLYLGVGDVLIYDKVDNVHRLIKANTLAIADLDTDRFISSDAFYTCKYDGIAYFGHKTTAGNSMWAADNEYKIIPDLTQVGGFTYTCTPTSAAVTGTCSWEANATIADLLEQLNSTTHTNVTFEALEGAIGVKLHTYNNGTLTLSNDTNVTITDCSFSCRIGINGAELGAHKGFQGTAVKTNFPTLDYMAATTTCYCKAGYNSSYRTVLNAGRANTYYSTSGNATYVYEETSDKINKKSVFDGLAETTGGGKAFYDKYNGVYLNYIKARMIDLDFKKGLVGSTLGKAKLFTEQLANVYYTGYNGDTKRVYLAAGLVQDFGISVAGYTTGFESGNWCMPDPFILGNLMEDDNLTIVRSTLSKLPGSTQIATNSSYLWTSAEYNGRTAWFYHADSGCLYNGIYKYYSGQVRPFLAFKIK